MKRIVAITLAAFAFSACDFGDPGIHQPQPVIEAWLIAGETIPPVRLTWTQSVETQYGSVPVGVGAATVTITQLASPGLPERRFTYAPIDVPSDVEAADGLYLPLFSDETGSGFQSRVVAGATYQLTADVPGYPTLAARTIVPGGFDIVGEPVREVVYQSTEQIEIDVSASVYPGRDAVYIISMESLDPSIDGLTPFLRDILFSIGADEEFDPSTLDPEELSEVILQSSPPLNEANWQVNPDASIRLKMPWFFAAFYGPQEITVSAIDDNVWNHFRYVNAQEGNGGFAPGEIPNVKAGVNDGHGLFGSLTRVRSRVVILREDG
ncbi:MAG: hypothetical protein ACI9W4_000140 [Rhodothermales bacterium]|jgi:hypothetical protein